MKTGLAQPGPALETGNAACSTGSGSPWRTRGPLPKGHAVLFGATEAGALRGGIRQPDGGAIPPQPSAA